jgi:hypothetical protein
MIDMIKMINIIKSKSKLNEIYYNKILINLIKKSKKHLLFYINKPLFIS